MCAPWELTEVLGRELVDAGLREHDTMQCIEESMTGLPREFSQISAMEASWY